MRKFIAITITITGLAAAAALPALASSSKAACGNVASDSWMSVQEITAKVEALGYDVRKVERDDGCYEVKGVNDSGKRFEIYLHPSTGEVVKLERDS